ncbi:MAG: UDP-N-acetylmuramoyl-tripeptide--D-alanyl-D-alanine ligase [Candidatus Scalindua sp. AMX11]|nr:MAG: UDP-N-acetylmuramoyl-tripeptide--D-alanyl-D-alanine ligase [Candidatus Scalindua sp.]TDE63477.1 MAG: UDP-N-acetylmuramoyl-tripeptide--D-alanyl-D-alanine ligase [Candidatus Scalindua sp. AMX11]
MLSRRSYQGISQEICMDRLTVADVLAATGGRLLSGNKQTSVTGVSTDTRSTTNGEMFFAINGENYNGHDFVSQAKDKGAVGAVISKTNGIANLLQGDERVCSLIEVEDTRKALGDLARLYRKNLRTKFIAITGSNGKTTTKDMVYHLLRNFKSVTKSINSFNNDIGVPLTIFETNSSHDFCVIEMGTNAPGEIRRLSEIISPNYTILTNISPTHLEGLRDIEGVTEAKAEFVENMDEEGTLIFNSDDNRCTQISQRFCGKVIGYGFEEEALIRASNVRRNDFGFDFTVNGLSSVALRLVGKHNIYNALAAISLCSAVGIRLEELLDKFEDFKPPPMRMERQTCGDIVIIHDEYNSSPLSMSAAIEEFEQLPVPGRRVFVCGDMMELGDKSEELHREIGEKVAQSNIDIICTVGAHSRWIAEEAISNGMPRENVRCYKNSAEISSLIVSLIRNRDTVLIKGSRKMKMEAISHQIENFFQGKS